MKGTATTVFSAFLLVLASSLYAQEQRNAIKLGLAGLPALEVQLKYERVIKKNVTFQIELAGGIPRSVPRPFLDPFLASGTDDQYERYNISEFTKSMKTAVAVIPELRLYPLRKFGLRGFYVAPYLKWKMHLLSATGIYKNFQMYPEAKMNANVMTLGAGLGLGYQMVFGGKRGRGRGFSLEIGAGIGFDYHLLNAKFRSSDPGEDYEVWKNYIGSALSGIPVYGKAFKAPEASGSSVVAKGNLPFVGLRPVLTLGYVFP